MWRFNNPLRLKSLRRDGRGAVAILVAASLPAMMGATGLGIDLGVWFREAARLQLGADAGAVGAARLLAAGNTSQSDVNAAAWQAAQSATNGGQWWGGSAALSSAAVTANSSQVTVTLTSSADRYFTAVFNVGAPALTASATAGFQTPAPCLLSLSASASNGILADGLGDISASLCAVFSDSISPTSIMVDLGVIAGVTVGAVGSILASGSSSTVVGGTAASAPPQPDPYASDVAPTPGACSYTNATFSGSQAFTQANNVFCGNTTIGGLLSSYTFAPGVYYVVNGNLNFAGANVTQAAGVTFVLTGSNPGAFNLTNSNIALTAPASGPTAGFAIWQTCPSSGAAPANSFSGLSSVQVAGEVYTPCGAVNLSLGANVSASPGKSFGVVASQVHVGTLASLSVALAIGGGTTGASQVALLQ